METQLETGVTDAQDSKTPKRMLRTHGQPPKQTSVPSKVRTVQIPWKDRKLYTNVHEKQ